MTLSAFPYPGGKTLLTDWIIEQIPAHHVYVEPFGGSAAVLLNKPRSIVEVYNDIDGDIVQFFDVAREQPDELIEWAGQTPYSEELYNRWAADYYSGTRPEDPVERAGRWLFLRFTQFGAKYDHTAGFKRDQPRKQRGSSHRWRVLEEHVGTISERLQGVSIQNGDYQDIIEKYDSENTVFYCDPPYLSKEHTYRVRDFDHGDLVDALSGIDGDAIVSYTDVPDGYTGWTELTRTHHHESDLDPKQVTERLFLNFDPADRRAFVDGHTAQTRLSEVTDD